MYFDGKTDTICQVTIYRYVIKKGIFMDKKKKLSFAIGAFIGVLVFICAVISCLQFMGNGSGKYAYIYQDGVLIRKIDLSENKKSYEFTIEYSSDTEHGFNTILVEDGKIGISDTDCPDKTCQHMGMINSTHFPITCLPHKLVIQIVDDAPNKDAPDVITH